MRQGGEWGAEFLVALRWHEVYLQLSVFDLLHQRLERLAKARSPSPLEGAWRGLEKESLRVTPDGRIAQSDHPSTLGAALTHSWITTDFGEAMVEFVTPPKRRNGQTLDFLRDLHRYVYERIGNELLWATSMPCFLGGKESVRIAHYGSSLSARMREVYRRGLAMRYGREMQTIAGVHFNFSPADGFWPALAEMDKNRSPIRELRDAAFFALLRNYRRFGWLVLYLFGASPAVCHSFFAGRATSMPELLPGTYYLPNATSLRMSDIGYRNRRQAGLGPSMNGLEAYVEALERAVRTPDPMYERLGVKVDGEWRQLSANLLQIENELYGFVRPKQPVAFGERPNRALHARGVAYVEVRALDVNPFEPVGVGHEQLRFMEAFLWFCLLTESPLTDEKALSLCDDAHRLVAAKGRQPDLRLPSEQGPRPLGAWAREILREMEPLCELLDGSNGGTAYQEALSNQLGKVETPEKTPSAILLSEIKARGTSFYHLALELSQLHRDNLMDLPPMAKARRDELDCARDRSLVAKEKLEAEQTGSLADYIQKYFNDEGAEISRG